MSTRYVWEKYTSYIISESLNQTMMSNFQNNASQTDMVWYSYQATVSNGTITLVSPYGVNPDDIAGYQIPQNCYFIVGSTSTTGTIFQAGPDTYVIRNSAVTIIYSYNAYLCAINTVYGKGSYIGLVANKSDSTYPSNNYSNSYWYMYKGSDIIDPTSISYSSFIKGGEALTLTVVASADNVYGGTITYNWEVQLDNGTWTSIGSGTSLSQTYTVPKGTNTFAARVKASDNMGFTSTDYITGSTYSVINNTAPSISGEDSDLGTFRYEYPTVSYTVTDPDEQTVTRKIELDSVIVAAEEAIILGQEYTYTVTEEQMSALADGIHVIKITATDSEDATAKRTYQFTKFFGSDTIYQRLRRLNDLGLYDTIYFENIASNIIRPNGMTVQETIDKMEADLAELVK